MIGPPRADGSDLSSSITALHSIARVGEVLRRPSVRRAIEGVTGTVLIGFGLRVAAEHRHLPV
jgi:threonine/homoserine/homoserine lactone efflux protein